MASVEVMQLGYLGFGVSDMDAWHTFMTRVLGLSEAWRDASGAVGYRMDGKSHRFVVVPDAVDDLLFVGLQVEDEAALAEAEKVLASHGVKSERASDGAASERRVGALVQLEDPAGIPIELYCGLKNGEGTFESACVGSRFVADDLGLGHLVVSTRTRDESRDFYMNVLGFRLSDYITCEFYGYPVDIAFMHTNARHHTIAVGSPMKKRVHHFMVEVAAMDDVGLAYDRARDHGVRIAQELGRHPNDRMFSFYALTPSGFQFEFGWGGREVDDATWKPTTYHQISEWGHRPPPPRIKKEKRA